MARRLNVEQVDSDLQVVEDAVETCALLTSDTPAGSDSVLPLVKRRQRPLHAAALDAPRALTSHLGGDT